MSNKGTIKNSNKTIQQSCSNLSQAIDIKTAEEQFRQECVCTRPLYYSIGLPKEIKINTSKLLEDIAAVETNQKPNIQASALKSISNVSEKVEDMVPKPQSSIYGVTLRRNKLYNFGERGSETKSKGVPQDYLILLKRHLARKTLFEDPEFPANNNSFYIDPKSQPVIKWKRPHELVENPQFLVKGCSNFDIVESVLEDSWFVAATANLTMYKNLFSWVVPGDQDFISNYAGIFHFRFWYFGRWIDIVIDDKLPIVDEQQSYFGSSESNEFWSALLQKAYAKLYGCYEALDGGFVTEAVEDFTGCLTEIFDLQDFKDSQMKLFQLMRKSYERHSLLECSLNSDLYTNEIIADVGLEPGHVYSITNVKHVEMRCQDVVNKISLLRLKSSSGKSEWKGPWGDGSVEWKKLSEREKEELGLTSNEEGEFWMTHLDFCKYFNQLEIDNLNPDSLCDEDFTGETNKRWMVSIFEGEWVKGVSAGGCLNFPETFWHNPQYRVTLVDADDGDDENKSTIIVGLVLKHRRSVRKKTDDNIRVGFYMFQLSNVETLPKPLDYNFFSNNKPVDLSPEFSESREKSTRYKLSPGTYCIVASAFKPDEEGEFLIRVFSEHPNNMSEHEKDVSRTIFEHDSPYTVAQAKESSIVYEMFTSLVNTGGELSWPGLKEILDKTIEFGGGKTFSKDTCRSMMATMDSDHSGKLNFRELYVLWHTITQWKKVFEVLDVKNEGYINGYKFRQALEDAGYTVNTRLMNLLMHRYGDNKRNITLDDFAMCAIRLKTMIDLFDSARDNSEVATFFSEDFIEKTMYS